MQSNDEIRPPEPEQTKPDVVTAENRSQVRGSFDVRAKRRGGGQNRNLWLGVGGIALIGLLAMGIMWTVLISQMSSDTKEVDESKIKADAALAADPGYDESMAKAKAEQIRKMESDAKKAAELQAQEEEARNALKAGKSNSGTANRGAGNVSAPADEDGDITPAQRKMNAAMIITPEVQSGDAYSSAGSSEHAGAGASSMPTRASVSSDGDMDSGGLEGGMRPRTRGSLSNLGGTSFTPVQAFLMPSRKYLVAHNTYTRCALYTEIVTDQPGLIDCRLTEPLYSADGSTVIAEAGAKLTGEQSVEVGRGQVQVFTSWTELETQFGVRAKLDSLGAGPMGASGTKAWINHHYKERFGGAVVLSLIQDALKAASNATQKGGSDSGYTVNNSEQNVENMADKALENTINIPDTGHILPGTVLTVIVARDIDFSSVYENH